jgi:hypothetical protein
MYCLREKESSSMFPVGDDVSAVTTVPVVTYGLIAANVSSSMVGTEFIRQ